jgi:hypothetical protein
LEEVVLERIWHLPQVAARVVVLVLGLIVHIKLLALVHLDKDSLVALVCSKLPQIIQAGVEVVRQALAVIQMLR